VKFSCHKSVLLDGINTVQRAVSPKNILPITQGILVETESNMVRFSATDTELGIQKMVEATVDSYGSTVVPARLFREIVSKLPDELIICHLKGEVLKLQYDESEIEIQTLDPDEFPVFPVSDNEQIVIPTDAIRDGLKKTMIAIAINDARTTITGVFVTLENGRLEIMATDANRMAIYGQDVGVERTFQGIIPGKTAAEILRLIEGEELQLNVLGTQLVFQFGSVTIYSRTLDGKFPAFKKLIPTDMKTKVEVDVNRLAGAIERASILAEGESKTIRIEGAEALTVRALNQKSGKINEKVYAEHDGEEIRINIKAKFMTDVLKVLDEQRCVIGFNGPKSAFVITEGQYQYVGMLIIH